MSKDRDEKSVADRRNFMKLATVGTVLGGAAIAVGGAARAEVSPAEAKGTGYRETPHVKTYYKLSRF
ncbi:MAG: twin-arginine translocation signal domain-containing protein [Rhodomicrobiaceae bacterium]